ncbi:MAG: chemotaxis protein CheX [Bacillota bacterium]
MLKASFINPFIKAASEVLRAECSLTARRGQLRIATSKATSAEVTVIVGVTGDLQGIVLYGMSERTAKALAAIMSNIQVPIFDSMAESAIAELGNMITGLATSGLEAEGYLCQLTPPTIVSGRGVIISTINIQHLVIPVETDHGGLEINVAIRNGSTVEKGFGNYG